MATARRETSDPLPSPLESKAKSQAQLALLFFFVADSRSTKRQSAPLPSYLTRGGSRRDLESEEVTTPQEIFVDAREKEEEEDEEVFLEAIQTDRVREAEEEERARERAISLSLSSFGNDESTWCVTDRERPALPSLSFPARDVCRGTLHRRRRCRSRREYLSKTPMIIFQKEEGERERKQEQTRSRRGEGGREGV